MKQLKTAAAILAGTLVFAVAGCSSAPQANNGAALQRLTVATPQEASSFDPVVSTEVATTEPIRNVFETLLTLNASGDPTPMLAESYTQSPDNMQISFKLRQGVKFHDGSEMTADDVVASMNRWLEYSSPGKASFQDATMEKVSETEVVLKLAKPNSAADLVLAYGESSIPIITKANIAETAGKEPMTQFIGTGPFKYVNWNKGQSLELERFTDYTPAPGPASGLAGDRTASYDKLTFEFTPDTSTEIAGLLSGQYDVALNVPYDNYDQIAANPDIQLETTEKTALPNLYFNKAQGLFSDVKAREALAVGLDRDALLKAGYANSTFYEVANGCMMPSSYAEQWPCDPKNKPGEPNPDRAKELLAEAGYSGQKVRIITSRDSGRAYQVSTVLQQQLKDLGIDAELETYDYATLNQKRAQQDAYELIVINNIAKIEPLQMFYIPPGNPGWTDADVIAPVIDAYQSAPSVEKRREVYTTQMQDWFTTYIPVVNIGSASDVYAVRKGITGIDSSGSTVVFWKAASA